MRQVQAFSPAALACVLCAFPLSAQARIMSLEVVSSSTEGRGDHS